jgi:hypothetical protein
VVLDVAYAHIFIPQRNVENSSLTAMDFGGGEVGPVVGNGTYRGRVDAIYLQLTALYGSVRKLPRREEALPAAAPGEPEDEPEKTLRKRGGDDEETARRPEPMAPGRVALAPDFADRKAPRLADPDVAEQVDVDRVRPVLRRARMERPAKIGRGGSRPAVKARRGRPAVRERPRCLQRDSQGRCLLERHWS